jgi:hypothetical protein
VTTIYTIARQGPNQKLFSFACHTSEADLQELADWCRDNLVAFSWHLAGYRENRSSLSNSIIHTDDERDVFLIRLRWPEVRILEFDAIGDQIFDSAYDTHRFPSE